MEHCNANGQGSWYSTSHIPTSFVAQEVKRDLTKLKDDTTAINTRIDRNVELLTALIDIGRGKQSLKESMGISRLTFFATAFIPASTVAAILGIEEPFAPGSSRFWIFLILAIPVTIIAFSVIYAENIKACYLGIQTALFAKPVKREKQILMEV